MILLLVLACGGTGQATLDARPQPMGEAECDVCGMVVREQPAPRGQLLYQDGSRAYVCSIGDLRADLAAPSPHGKVVATWVESLPADFDPAAPPDGALPWIPADQARFVVGFARAGTMGQPGLSYADQAEAEAEAKKVGGHVVSWAQLQAAGFNAVP